MTDRPKTTFTITLRGQQVVVAYVPEYFRGVDHFEYLSPHDPPRPIPISETGYRSQFANVADVQKAGGPEPYAIQYAEGELAQKGRKKPRKKAAGGHAARVRKGAPPVQEDPPAAKEGHAAKEEEREAKRGYTQRDLF